jgi:hypothetical protein
MKSYIFIVISALAILSYNEALSTVESDIGNSEAVGCVTAAKLPGVERDALVIREVNEENPHGKDLRIRMARKPPTMTGRVMINKPSIPRE